MKRIETRPLAEPAGSTVARALDRGRSEPRAEFMKRPAARRLAARALVRPAGCAPAPRLVARRRTGALQGWAS